MLLFPLFADNYYTVHSSTYKALYYISFLFKNTYPSIVTLYLFVDICIH